MDRFLAPVPSGNRHHDNVTPFGPPPSSRQVYTDDFLDVYGLYEPPRNNGWLTGRRSGRPLTSSLVIIMSGTAAVASPSGSSSSTPVMILQPRDTFVVRNNPATVTCRALNTRRIRFKCNEQWIDQKHQVNKEGVDEVSGLAYFEASIPVSRPHVEHHFDDDDDDRPSGGYRCECYASGDNEQNVVKSDPARIRLAYLRKHFYSAPASEHLPLGSTVQLPCLPPDGDPKPEVFWLKNGVELRRGGDPNVILANDGSIIVSAARLSDSGNYTCGAANIATKRLSDTAFVSIYVDGGWSNWSDWVGDCQVDCRRLASDLREFRERGSLGSSSLIPKTRRYRTCDSPAPRNNGRACLGLAEQHTDCPLDCPLDGAWTQWSEWSVCSRECHRYRTRHCDDPAPRNGGRACAGVSFETKNCPKGRCGAGGRGSNPAGEGRLGVPPFDTATGTQRELVHHRQTSSSLTTSGPPLEVSIALYAGLAAFTFLLVLLLVLVAWLLTRRRGGDSSAKGGGRKKKHHDVYYADGGHNAGQLRTVLGATECDLTRNALLAHPDGKGLPPERGDHPDEHHYAAAVPAYAVSSVGAPPPPGLSSFSLRSGGGQRSSASTPYGSRRGGAGSAGEAQHPPQNRSLSRKNVYGGGSSFGGGSRAALMENESGASSSSTQGGGGSSHPPSLGSTHGDGRQTAAAYGQRDLEEEPYAELYDYGVHEEERENMRNSLIASAYLSRVNIDSLAVNRFDHRGGRLSLPHCSVLLTIPEGALDPGHVEEFYVAVCHDPADRPRLADRETLVSPVVVCGPSTALLRKPVILTVPHCARMFPRGDHWRLAVLNNDGAAADDDEQSRWTQAVVVGEETVNTELYCQVDQERLCLMTTQLGRYAVVGRTAPQSRSAAVKRMKLLAFAPLYPSSLDYSLRVYCVQDTDAAVQAVMTDEEQLSGYLVADERNFGCQEGGDLCFCVEDVSASWRAKPQANYQEIPARHLWANDADRLHCSFSLEASASDVVGDPPSTGAPSAGSGGNLSARIVVYQKGATKSRQIIQVNTALAPMEQRLASSPSNVSSTLTADVSWQPSPPLGTADGVSRSSSTTRKTTLDDVTGATNTPSPYYSTSVETVERRRRRDEKHNPSIQQQQQHQFKLPVGLKRHIGQLLDKPMKEQNDWRMLAKKLNVDRYIQYFGLRPSPTEQILDLWEARESSSSATIVLLVQTLRTIGRTDAASLIEDFLEKHPVLY